MRIDQLNNFQRIVERERGKNYRRIVYFLLIVAGCAYASVLLSVFVFKRSDGAVTGQLTVTKYEAEVIRVSANEAAAGSKAVAKALPSAMPSYRPAGKIRHSYSTAASSYVPQHQWQSTSAAGLKVYTTSSASVKNIGSGASSSGGQVSGVTVTAQSSAFGTSTSIMVVPTIARVSARNLNAANTMAAEAEVLNSSTSERAAKPGIRRVDDDPLDPMLDPIGDGLWALLILALGYGAFMFYRRKSHSIINNQ